MRLFKLFLCCMLFIVMSCSDSTGPGDTGDGEILAHETVGAEGGSVSSDEVSISVPAGAFSDDTSIALTTAPENPFEEDALSGAYVIAGLPQSYGDEITVSLAYDGEPAGSSYIAVGVNTWVSSYGEMAMTYSMFPATVDGDMLTATLPATGLAVGKAAMTGEDESSSVSVVAVKGYEPHVTAGGHFRIDYASRWTTLASVQELGQYLEEAYLTIPSLGFSLEERTNWPVSVTVMDMGKKDGASSSSLWGVNYGYLMFNRNIMDNPATMRTTAGHEFFHLVQALYDPRDFYSKAKREAPHLWLDEACSVWAEEKFSDLQDYVSAARAGNILAPYNGVVAEAAEGGGEHGYGLSGMIKYLVDEYGESCLINIYEKLKSGSDAMTAVILSTESPAAWWEEFLRQYTLGEIYGVEPAQLTANNEGIFRILSESDSLQTYTAEYPDLSGKLYLIRPEDTSFDENAVLSLSVEGGMGEITAIKYRKKPLAIELVDTNTEKVTVSDLKSLQEGGWYIIALVSNSRCISPYTENSTITLTCRVSAPIDPGFTYFTLHPELVGDFEYVSYVNSAFNKTYTSTFYPSYSPAGWGTLNGTTFTGTRNEPSGYGTVVGNYTIEFDETFQNILSIEATQSHVTPGDEDSGDSFQNVTFSARNIPFSWNDDGTFVYQLVGNNITDQVTSMTFEYGIEGDRLTKLVDYRGGTGASIILRIWKRE